MSPERVRSARARPERIAAFDPGRNVGFALLDGRGTLLRRDVLELADLRGLHIEADAVVVGSGTGRQEVIRVLQERGIEPAVVDETATTLAARRYYFRDHPPRGWLRLLPAGMRTPPRPIDDYAAYVIGLRYLAELGGGEET